MRLELLAGQDSGHQIQSEVADVPALAGVGRRALDRPEHVHELVDRHHRPQRVSLGRFAGVQVDDRRAGKAEAGARTLPAHVLVAELARRAVEVDEVGLLRLVEADVRELEADLLEGGADPARRPRQLDVRDVERAERTRTARGREEVEARRPRRVLAAPPGVERGDVADDPRRELREPVGRVGWPHIGDMDRVGRRRIRRSVDARGARAAPGHRRRGVCGQGRDDRDEGRQRREPELHAGHGTRPR